MQWVRYQINYGDNLSKITHRFNTTISQIKSVNNLHNNMVKVDECLIVSVSQNNDQYYFISEELRRSLKNK